MCFQSHSQLMTKNEDETANIAMIRASRVQDRLVSTDRPHGTVTNSDLEHAGLLAQLAVMASV